MPLCGGFVWGFVVGRVILVKIPLFSGLVWGIRREEGFSWCTCLCLVGLSGGFVVVRVFLGVYDFVSWVVWVFVMGRV